MQLHRITAIADILSPGAPEFSGERPYAATGDVDDEGNVTVTSVTYSTRPSRADLVVQRDDVLFARMQATKKVLIITDELENYLFSTGFCALRPKAGMVRSSYLKHYLNYPLTQLTKDRYCSGATQKAITNEKVAELLVPLPEKLDQQDRIARILDKAEIVLKKRRCAVELTETLVRSAFLELLEHLAEKRVAIENLLPATPNAIRTGPFGSQLLHAEFTDSGIPVLGIDNVVTNQFRWAERRYVTEDKYKELRRYRVFPGDVMITIMGTTGRVCIAPENLPECISTKHLCTITPDRQRLLPEYLWASLMWDPVVRAQAAREGKGAIMEGWNMGIVRGLMIKLPTIVQQERFAKFVRKVEELRFKLLAAEAESNQLFGSLAQRSFSGHLFRADQ